MWTLLSSLSLRFRHNRYASSSVETAVSLPLRELYKRGVRGTQLHRGAHRGGRGETETRGIKAFPLRPELSMDCSAFLLLLFYFFIRQSINLINGFYRKNCPSGLYGPPPTSMPPRELTFLQIGANFLDDAQASSFYLMMAFST